jgi:hypothetical protein
MLSQRWFYVGWGLLSTVFTVSGAVWALSPELFVRVWRRVAVGDYYIRSEEWKQKVVTRQGRIAGGIFCFAGLYGLYMLLKVLGKL